MLHIARICQPLANAGRIRGPVPAPVASALARHRGGALVRAVPFPLHGPLLIAGHVGRGDAKTSPGQRGNAQSHTWAAGRFVRPYGLGVIRTIDTLLLLALPASGKSELRRYLAHLDPAVAERDLHLGPTTQLDDYPYVHFMRRIAEELSTLGEDPIFFRDIASSFTEPRDWGTLIHLLNEDYERLGAAPLPPVSAACWLFDRLDVARSSVGAAPSLGLLDAAVRLPLARTLELEAVGIWEGLVGTSSAWTEGDTIVIEFARGGPDGAVIPLSAPHGYAYSLEQLSEQVRDRASILYVWVTPEESRRRNEERARPGRTGDASILHHGVPEAVMLGDYGSDDMPWLIEQGGGGGVRVGGRGSEVRIPVAVFDNRTDHTSFLREDPDRWAASDVVALHDELRSAFHRLVR